LTTICRFSALLFALLLAACDGSPKFRGTDITGADYGRTLALTGHDGKPRTLEDFRGKAVVLFFGYTRCPDVCPTTLVEMSAAMKALGKDADRVQVLFVTVDPARDTPDVLSKYVPAFDSRFLGLYGDEEATRRVTKEFKIFHEKVEGGAPGAYTVNHSAQSYVFDTKGRLRLFERHERLGKDLVPDLRVLLGETG
jgi:protein SCO1/2